MLQFLPILFSKKFHCLEFSLLLLPWAIHKGITLTETSYQEHTAPDSFLEILLGASLRILSISHVFRFWNAEQPQKTYIFKNLQEQLKFRKLNYSYFGKQKRVKNPITNVYSRLKVIAQKSCCTSNVPTVKVSVSYSIITRKFH